jgi:O-antigen ligase
MPTQLVGLPFSSRDTSAGGDAHRGAHRRVGALGSASRLTLALLASGLGLALFLGLSVAVLPWFLLIALAVVVVYPVLVFRMPWIAFAIYVAVVFMAPGFKSADAITLGTLGLFVWRWLLHRGPMPSRQIVRPYMVFLVGVGVAGALGLFFYRYPVSMVYGDGRGFVYWLWLPLLYSLATGHPDGIRSMARVLAFVAGLVTFVALVQYFFGIRIITSGRVGGVDTGNLIETRVQMHGFLFVTLAIVWSLVALVHHPKRAWWLTPVLMLLLVALYVNFGRALWFWTLAAVLLAAGVSGLRRGSALALLVFVGATTVGLTLAQVKPEILGNIVERFESVRDEGGPRSSYGWRKRENEAALLQISRSPLVGLGLGAEYRSWIVEIARFDEHTRYVHNSYIFLAVKAGLPALAALVALLLISWWRGYRGTRSADVPERTVRIAALASLPPLLGVSITQPELVTPMSVLLFASMVVLMASCEVPRVADKSPV